MPLGAGDSPFRGDSAEHPCSLAEHIAQFPDDAACLDYLWRARFAPDGEHATCPKCEQVRVFRRYTTAQGRHSWTCTRCGHHVHPTAGTIYARSSTPLHLWFYAQYLMASTGCSLSAKQLERELGVTYKTAWRIADRIRTVLVPYDRRPAVRLGRVDLAPIDDDRPTSGAPIARARPGREHGRASRTPR